MISMQSFGQGTLGYSVVFRFSWQVAMVSGVEAAVAGSVSFTG